jgi:hypothetical protein
MEDPEYLDLKDLQFLSALVKQSKEKRKKDKKSLDILEKSVMIKE